MQMGIARGAPFVELNIIAQFLLRNFPIATANTLLVPTT